MVRNPLLSWQSTSERNSVHMGLQGVLFFLGARAERRERTGTTVVRAKGQLSSVTSADD